MIYIEFFRKNVRIFCSNSGKNVLYDLDIAAMKAMFTLTLTRKMS